MDTFKIKKILVPTDFSETAGNALSQALYIAKLNKATIKLIHVVVPTYIPSQNSLLPSNDTFYATILDQSKKGLKKLAAEIAEINSIRVSYEVKSGNISDEICDIAKKEKVDIIIMGTHGTSGVKEFFAGSNAYKVVNHAECPVLTIQKIPNEQGFKNIILPIRLEITSRQKVDYSIEMARLFDATIFITGYTDDKNESNQFKIKQYVEQVEKYLTKHNVKHKSTSIFADNFTKEILDYAKKNNADLIVVMKKHDFSLDQLLKGVYSEQFVNHSAIPILSIPVFSDPDMMTHGTYLVGDLPF
jgi:nucleotide-binding universal stress UspA family protein